MATKQQLLNTLRDLLTVIPQYDTSHCSQDYRDTVAEAKKLLESETDKPAAKTRIKDIECKPVADNLFLWAYRDGREFKASFAHDQKHYNSIVASANSRAAAACRVVPKDRYGRGDKAVLSQHMTGGLFE